MDDAGRLGVTIIGLGTVGRRFVEQVANHERFRLVAGFDVDELARKRAEQDFGIITGAHADALIGDPAVDVVYIATPPLFHETYVDAALAAGKAIFCEKPLGVDGAATVAMVERVDAAGLPAAVNFVFGAAPSATELLDRITSGACGKVHSAELRVHFCRWPRDWRAGATWLRDRDQGGWIREVVSHYLFLVHRLFGTTTIRNVAVDFPDDGSSEQGLTAVLDCAGRDEIEFTVRGTERSFRLSNWYQLTTAADDGPWEPVLTDEQSSGAAAYAAQLGDLAALIEGGPHRLATFAEGLAVQRLVEDLLRSGAG